MKMIFRRTPAVCCVLAATVTLSEASVSGAASLVVRKTRPLSVQHGSAATSVHINDARFAFQQYQASKSPISIKRSRHAFVSTSGSTRQHIHNHGTAIFNNSNDDESTSSSSFLSTSKASVTIPTNNNANTPANLSPIDSLILTITSSQTSLILGAIGITLLLLLRLISFPEDAIYEASRSRIDLLGVFAAGSVLLNGITKLDVTSVQAEGVVLEGVTEGVVTWTTTATDTTTNDDYDDIQSIILGNDKIKSTVEWTLSSFLRCSPARTAVLLATNPGDNKGWMPLARVGIVPSNPKLRTSIPVGSTPILDRMLRTDGAIKGGTVGGVETAISSNKKGPKESYLPTLQALPGKVEFTYLPGNAQEALILPVSQPRGDNNGWYFAIVLGGDTAKSFVPRDIAWCKEVASWIGDLL